MVKTAARTENGAHPGYQVLPSQHCRDSKASIIGNEKGRRNKGRGKRDRKTQV